MDGNDETKMAANPAATGPAKEPDPVIDPTALGGEAAPVGATIEPTPVRVAAPLTQTVEVDAVRVDRQPRLDPGMEYMLGVNDPALVPRALRPGEVLAEGVLGGSGQVTLGERVHPFGMPGSTPIGDLPAKSRVLAGGQVVAVSEPPSAATATQEFTVASRMLHNGDLYEIGAPIRLTRQQWLDARTAGSVAGNWREAGEYPRL